VISKAPFRWTIGLTLCLGLFCTIRDDNGNPAAPGSEQPETVDVNTAPDIIPSLIVTPDSAYVYPEDTLGIRVAVFGDSSGNDSLIPLTGYVVQAQTTHGSLIEDSLVSDGNGRVRFLFTASSAGNVEFTAECNNTEQTVRFEVTETPVQVQKLLQALPGRSILKADGRDSTVITVSVLNTFRNPIAGECVQFITSAGTVLGATDGCGNSGQSITDKYGVARAKLISSNVNDTAFITAFLVSDQSLSDEIDVIFQGMSIQFSSSNPKLRQGDTTVITATVLNASDLPAAKAPVFFQLADGDNSILRILSIDTMTNYEGVATARIRASDYGTDMLTVFAAGTKSTMQINVSALSMDLEIDKTILQTQTTDTAHIIATFTNANGSPLSNHTVKMSRSFKQKNDIDSSDVTSKKTNSSGQCTFTIPAIPWEGRMYITITGYDNTEGYTSTDTMLQFITTRVMTIRPPQPILADGVSKGAVQVIIKNSNGNPIVGDYINFSTTAGTITAQSQTNEDGKAVVYIISDRRNIEATVTATLESDPSKTQQTTVLFKGVEINALANPPGIRSSGEDSSIVLITLYDAASLPIVGERYNISKQKETTVLTRIDSVTNNEGEAHCKISGTGSGQDTLQISAAGAVTSVVINYSSNILEIKKGPNEACVADSSDSTLIIATYYEGDHSTRIGNAQMEISATVGNMDTVFARTFTTDNNGRIQFYLKNPHFAVTAKIFGIARTSSELTTSACEIYFKANNVARIDLAGTPEVITIDGGKAKIDAIAYDNLGNRVKDASISFNIVNGPSGGEYLDPPVSLTGDDGKATTYLISGKTPSTHRQVWITAGTFSSIKSDTVKFTIAGPPHYINIGSNILRGKDPKDGTFILPCAALVTDVNGNPVADGTEVTFSLKISGYVTYRTITRWYDYSATTNYWCEWYQELDTLIFPFEDFNDNYHLDPGEDRNRDGIANRGEDVNGDGIFNPGPPFEDINNDGIRQYSRSVPVEDRHVCGLNTDYFADQNGNGAWDPIEPLLDKDYFNAYQRLQADTALWNFTAYNAQDSADFAIIDSLDSVYTAQAEAAGGFDYDAPPYNGIADPNSAVSVKRTVETKDGKALNEILYGQSDALHIEVMIWAESQGVVTETPEQVILPIILSGDE
jgi:hypothetical protein